MPALSLVSAAVLLLSAVVAGVIAHELSHALALRLAGVSCSVDVLPGEGDERRFRASALGPIATVTPERLPDDLSTWYLRAAAMMPLCLLVPFALVATGVLPDPFASGDQSVELAAIAWLGCSLPSPQDFSLLWHPEQAIAEHRRAASSGE